jgi:LCP family protein required for cell wall assembly
MRVYTAEGTKKKKRRWLRVLLWTFGILLLLAAIAAGALYLYLKDAVETITSTNDPSIQKAQEEDLAPKETLLPGAPRVALVIGEDQRPGDVTWRSDTMMLVRLDPKTKTMSILSFPRDLMVDIPGQGHLPINEAFARGKERLALQTVNALTGIRPNYLVPVNFKGFEDIVDAFGPVWVEVDRRYYNKNLGTINTDFDEINLQPGYQPLDGSKGLDFVRHRHSDSDIMRVGRQQAFISEFKKRLDVWTAARDIFRLIGIAKDNVKILGAAKGGAPDIDTFQEYGSLLTEVGNVDNVQIETYPAPEDPKNKLAATPESIQKAVNQFLHPDTTVANRLTDRDVGKDTTKQATPKKKFAKAAARIEIRNGGFPTDPVTGDVEYLLAERGWKKVFGDGNADAFDYLHTTIYHDGTTTGQAIATAVAKEFTGARVEKFTPETRAKLSAGNNIDAGVLIVVGTDWNGELAAPVEAQLPEVERGNLTARDPRRDLDAWKAAQKQTSIQLMMPTQLEQNMRLGDPAVPDYPPMRVYKVGGHKAFHATYYGYDKYYGVFTIQAIQWRNPPILESPSNTRKIEDGRTLELFYNGDHIRRIAWRQGSMSYWISNSFVDYFPNSVMIAIAKSFVPVPK